MAHFTMKEYKLLHDLTNERYLSIIVHGDMTERKYKKHLKDMMTTYGTPRIYSDIYEVLYGSFKKIPLYINITHPYLQSIIKWRMMIGH